MLHVLIPDLRSNEAGFILNAIDITRTCLKEWSQLLPQCTLVSHREQFVMTQTVFLFGSNGDVRTYSIESKTVFLPKHCLAMSI